MGLPPGDDGPAPAEVVGAGPVGAGPASAGSAGAGSAGAGSAGAGGAGTPALAGGGEPADAAAALPDAAAPATGDARVDEAVRRFDDLAGLPVSEHPAVFEFVHDRLTEVLGDLDVGPGVGGDVRGPGGPGR